MRRWVALAAAVIVADQLSKAVVLASLRLYETVTITPFFDWVLAMNAGASFSMLANSGGWQRWLFTVLALGISAWLLLMLRRHHEERALSLALSLILGGALGNVIDRLRFGAVVDFIQVHAGSLYWPAFNVADSAICIGAALLVWVQLRSGTSAEN